MTYIVSKNDIILFVNTSYICHEADVTRIDFYEYSIHVTSRIVSMTVGTTAINDTRDKYHAIRYHMPYTDVCIFANDINP